MSWLISLIPSRGGDVCFSQHVLTDFETQLVLGAVPLEHPHHDANHSHISSAKVKVAWSSVPHLHVILVCCLSTGTAFPALKAETLSSITA